VPLDRGALATAVALTLAALFAADCAAPSQTPTAAPTIGAVSSIRYLALGDSYTIGTSVGEGDRWPNQLVARLADRVPLELIANLGVNGYSTDDLIDHELPQVAGLAPDFVTLLIGVNDVVRGVPETNYRSNVALILDRLLEHLPAQRIVAVSVPDYTLTPRGGDFGDSAQQGSEIALFNSSMASEAASRGIAFVDISPVANRAGEDRSLVAGDGLHPSGKQYSGWVDLIAPVVERAFATSDPQ
jgi:acyl-CoA thioesterase I